MTAESSLPSDLAARWTALREAAGIHHGADELCRAIANEYQAPERHFHTLDHIRDCLGEFEGLRARASSPVAIELAIWMHDVVYDTHRSDNEAKSGEFAFEQLTRAGVDPALAERVRQLILVTRHDAEPVGADEAMLVDVDLSILGQPQAVYDRYEAAVRREYQWVPDELFWPRRAEILSSFLRRERIYRDLAMAARLETRARENLARSVTRARRIEP